MTSAASRLPPGGKSVPLTERRYLVPFVLITSLFFLWAFGVNLNDILIPHLKKAFGLTDFQSSFIQVAFFGGYFLAAFPAGWVMERIGYKKGILTGLLLCATGAVLFLPASSSRVYGFFLLALFVMACGQSFLEVASNPYVTMLGPAGSAERRLNFAQSFNAVGAVLSPIIGRTFILTGVEYAPAQIAAMSTAQLAAYRAAEASTVKGPYLVMAGIFHGDGRSDFSSRTCRSVGSRRRKSSAADSRLAEAGKRARSPAPGARRDRAVLLRGRAGGRGQLRDPLRAILCSRDGGKARGILLAVPPDRFHGGAFYRLRRLMKRISGAALAFCCLLAGFLCASWWLCLHPASFQFGPWCCIGFFHSIMFPTIFALSIKDLGPLTKRGSSLLVMAIIGGAVFPAIMGRISDAASIQTAFRRAALLLCLHPLFRNVGLQAGAAPVLGRAHSRKPRAALMTRRYCLTLDLKDDPALIAEYKRHHRENLAGNHAQHQAIPASRTWKYTSLGTRLFMIMEVNAHFSFEEKTEADRNNSTVQEWEQSDVEVPAARCRSAPRRKMVADG